MSFIQFMRTMSDVCRVYQLGNDLVIERVSNKVTSHMDHLTIVNKKSVRRPLTNSYQRQGSYVQRPTNRYLQASRPSPQRSNAAVSRYTNSRAPLASRLNTAGNRPHPPIMMKHSYNADIENRAIAMKAPQHKHVLPSQLKKVVYGPASEVSHEVSKSTESDNELHSSSSKESSTLGEIQSEWKPKHRKPLFPENFFYALPNPNTIINNDLATSFSNIKLEPIDEDCQQRLSSILFRDALNAIHSEKSSFDNSNNSGDNKNLSVKVEPTDNKENRPQRQKIWKLSRDALNAIKKEKSSLSMTNSSEDITNMSAKVEPIANNKESHRLPRNQTPEKMLRDALNAIKPKNSFDMNNNSGASENSRAIAFSILRPRMKPLLPGMFFKVKLMELSSPSQFEFQFSQDILQLMTDEMK